MMKNASTKYAVEIRVPVPNTPNPTPQQPFTVRGTGGSVRIALARAAEQLAPSLRGGSKRDPQTALTVDIRRVY